MINAYRLIDGRFDFYDVIEVGEGAELPEGYAFPDPEKSYKDTGEVMTAEEIEAIHNTPQPIPPEQKIALFEEQLAIEREDKLMVMEALADVYEMVLTLQSGGGAA
jgi:hypothetical protein